MGRDLKPLSPAEESLIGFRRDLYGISDEIRQHKREAMLNTTVEDLITAASELKEQLKSSVSIVMGPTELIEEIAERRGEEIKINTLVLPM